MADDSNAFLDAYKAGSDPTADQQSTDNPFLQAYKQGSADQEPSTFGAFGRSAARSVVPSAGGLAGAAAGAEVGALAGPWGALAGGLVGAIGGGWAAGKAQDYAVHQLPPGWRDPLEEQEQKDTAAHPYASFLGGLVPMAATMQPGALVSKAAALPETATALQRIMANPTTGRLFGGALQGGIEIGQEKVSGEDLDWRKVAISTAFGLVFNKPNPIGERISELGARPTRALLGRPQPAGVAPTAPARPGGPTLAEANDVGVAGAGANEESFQHPSRRDPTSAMVAADAARTEKSVLEGPPQPDLHAVARQMEPDLFGHYDELSAQRDTFRNWIAEFNNPTEEAIQEANAKARAVQDKLTAHIESQKGYTGGAEARRLRAQVRDAQAQAQEVAGRAERFKAGAGVETPELAQARRHMMAIDEQMRDLAPQVAAARRRAADMIGAGTVPPAPIPSEAGAEPAQFRSLADMIAANGESATAKPLTEQGKPAVEPAKSPASAPPEKQEQSPTIGQPVSRETPPVSQTTPTLLETAKTMPEQKAFIAGDVARQMIAAGRPAEEAEAAGRLIAARYATRAATFKGALGTAEELYRREGADIRGPNGRAAPPTAEPRSLEMAHGTLPPEVTRTESAPVGPEVEDLRAMIARKASPDELANHPVFKEAEAKMSAIEPTDKQWGPDPNTPSDDWMANREFNVDGQHVQGYDAATELLNEKAEAYSTHGPVRADGQAFIVIGPPASGKSAISERIARNARAAIVDADDAKAALPEYEGGVGASAVHEESGILAGHVLDDQLGKRNNVVIPKVGHSAAGIGQFVDLLKSRGYDVHLVSMNVSDDEAFRRMVGRFLSTGRLINPEYFRSIDHKPQRTYEALKGDERVSSYAEVNGNGPRDHQPVAGVGDAYAAIGQPGRARGYLAGPDASGRANAPEAETATAGATDAVKPPPIEQSGYTATSIGRLVEQSTFGGAPTIGVNLESLPAPERDRLRALANGLQVVTREGVAHVPDEDHARLLEIGERIASGDKMESPEDERALQSLFDRFKGFVIEDDMAPFSSPDDVRSLARDYYEDAETRLRRGKTADIGDMLSDNEARRKWTARLLSEAAEGRGNDGAVRAAYEATDKINSLTHAQQKRELPEYTPEIGGKIKNVGDGQPAGVFMFNPLKLSVDANRFQFKSGGDEYGVTGALRSVTKWDRSKAQAIIVWEQADGTLFVADGHQRSGLARRLIEQSHEGDIELPGILYREVDGVTSEHAKAIAAATNIANGSGSALDGAKILRAYPDLMDGSLPLSVGKGQQAAALAKLADEPFRMVVNDVVPEHFGALVGQLIPGDEARQVAAIKAMARFEPKNADEASALIQHVAQTELAKAEAGRQTSMFGDLETPESTAGEEMKIVGAAIKGLKSDKALFGRVLHNAERIEQTGSHIERDTAQAVASDAEVFARQLASDAYTAGPVRDALRQAAKELKDGKIKIGDATSRIVAALRTQAETDVHGGAGDLGRAPEPTQEGAAGQSGDEREFFQRKQQNDFGGLNFEPGAEKKPQSLVPGVAPITDRDRIMAAANKPLRGGNAPMQEGGLFGEGVRAGERQGELFQAARGSIRIMDNDVRPVIKLMADANASTFIHETGHDFLEQLKRDAGHEAAPDQLRADWETVQSYLGAKDGELKTRHHEKFATSFEQYLREGVAPSKELAGVFSRFRDWLVGIYQTIKGLGKPINEDIRAVFDRMLSEDPQRTVIAPEEARGPTIHDIHTEEAAYTTDPHEAAAAQARVDMERQRAEVELKPEIANEIAPVIAKIEAERAAAAGADNAGADGGGAGGPGEMGGGGGGPQPVAGSSSGGEGTGAERGGERAAGPESAGSDGRTGKPDAGEPSRSGQPAPRPADLFGPSDTRFVDKAGNIRLENLTSVEDVKQAIRDMAGRNNDFIGDRRGVVTDGDVMNLALDLGMEGAEKLVRDRVLGQAFNAEQIMALRLALRQSAGDAWNLAKKARESKSPEDLLAAVKASNRHQMIQATVSQATAEWGRAGRALRNITDIPEGGDIAAVLQQATGKTLFQLQAETGLMSAMDSPQAVSKFIHDSQNPKFGSMILEYWINGLISGPATHTTYMIGNTLLGLQKAAPETLAAAMIGRMRQAMGREGPRVQGGEVGAQLGNLKLAPALKAAAEAFRTGKTTLLPGEDAFNAQTLPFEASNQLAEPARYDESATYRDAMSSAFGIVRGVLDGLRAGGDLLKAGGVDGAPTWGARHSVNGAIPDVAFRGVGVAPIGEAIRLPGRFIASIHSLFRSINYSMEKGAQTYRMAANEGLTGEALAARIGELRQNPSEDMMQSFVHEATELTLMGQGSEFTKAMSKLTNVKLDLPFIGETQVLKFIDPFVHISSNVIDQSIVQRTPLGLIMSPELRRDILGQNGNIAQDKAMARMLVGSAMSIGFGALAAQGYASGSGPSDPKEAAMWRLAGNQAHSVRIGDVWYDTHRLGPLGMILGVAADMYDVAHKASQGEMLEAGAHLQHAITQNILDESFMRGPSDLIKAVEDPGRYGEAYLRNWGSSFVPYSVGMAQMARASDPYSRQARTVMDAIKQKIPGLSEQLLPRRDVWGEPMANKDALGAAGLTAIYEQQMSHDPVNRALLNLGIAPSNIPRSIRNVDLDEQQYDDFARIAGRMTKMRLDAIVNSSGFNAWPAHIQHDVIVETIRQSREAARGVMMMKNPQIMRQATQDRLSHARGEDIRGIGE